MQLQIKLQLPGLLQRLLHGQMKININTKKTTPIIRKKNQKIIDELRLM